MLKGGEGMTLKEAIGFSEVALVNSRGSKCVTFEREILLALLEAIYLTNQKELWTTFRAET